MALANKKRLKCHKIQLKIVYRSFLLLERECWSLSLGERKVAILTSKSKGPLYCGQCSKEVIDLCLEEYDFGREALYVLFFFLLTGSRIIS